MSLNKLTDFQVKHNAKYHGDPNGTYIMAEDINLIQDAINQLESVIGIHGSNKTLTERIEDVERNAALRADKFIVYKGNPLLAYGTLDESVHAFSFVEHLVLMKQQDLGFDTFLSSIQKAQTHLYGYIDCTSTNSLAMIQLDMEWWKDHGAVGVFLDNFDYAFGNTRNRQNDLMLSAQERGMRAIVTGDMNSILFNSESPQNPEWKPLNFTNQDAYYTTNVFIQNAQKKSYDEVLAKGKELARAKHQLGIRIYIEDTANGASNLTQVFYEHGHSLALLFGIDGYFLTRTDWYALNDPIRYYAWAPFLGSWNEDNAKLIETVGDIRRRTSFGEIIYVKSSNTIVYTGLTIPTELIQWKANSIDGSAIMDSTIEDSKIKDYNGDRLVQAINKEGVTSRVDLDRIEKFGLNDLDGSIKVESLTANVINAINANIGHATIDSAVIGKLDAGHITADVIEAINIAAGHIEAGSAYIHGAVIDQLSATSIKAGDIAAQHIKANVLEAINAKFTNATIDSAVIGELKAENITASVIQAINMYAESAVIDKAKINTAIIGELSAQHIQASVIDALKANIGKATIDNALIGELEAKHIQTSVIDAVNANIGHAVIDGAVIGEGTIYDSKIFNLSASKVTAGTIDTSKVTLSGLDGHLVIDDNSIEIYDGTDAQGNRRKRVVLGQTDILGPDVYGLAVLGPDGQTRLYDHTGVYNAGIHDNVISNIKLQDDAVDARVISVGSIFARHIQAGNITSEKIGVGEVKAVNIQTGSIGTDKLYSGGKLRSVSDNKKTTVTAGTLQNGGPAAKGLNPGVWIATAGAVLTVDLGAVVQEVREISFTSVPFDNLALAPKDYKIEYSVDGTAWTSVVNITNNVIPFVSHQVHIPTGCRYVRLTIVKPQDGQTSVQVAGLEVKSINGGTIITGDVITTGTIDANLVTVKNLKAGSITVGPDSTFEDGYDPFAIWGYAQNLSMKGLALKPDYKNFTTAEAGSLYIHGFDEKGIAADVDGYLMVNGTKKTIPRGVIKPGQDMRAYIFFDDSVKRWFVASMDNDTIWRRYNVGTPEHGLVFIPNSNCYFVGHMEP